MFQGKYSYPFSPCPAKEEGDKTQLNDEDQMFKILSKIKLDNMDQDLSHFTHKNQISYIKNNFSDVHEKKSLSE